MEPSAAASGEPCPEPSRRLERQADGFGAVKDPGKAEEGRASVLHGGCGGTDDSFTLMQRTLYRVEQNKWHFVRGIKVGLSVIG